MARLVAGGTLLGIGALLLVLPGPGVPFVVVGLTLLEWDCVWARRLRRWLAVQGQRWLGSRPAPSQV